MTTTPPDPKDPKPAGPAALLPWVRLMASKAYGNAPAAAPMPSTPQATAPAGDEEEEDDEFGLGTAEEAGVVEVEVFDRANREQIIKDYVPLVKFVAHRISNRLPSHVELDDLIHSGILGLMDAVEKFDPARGIKFKTYAELRVKGAILDGLRDLDWVPRSLRRKKKSIEQAYHAIEQRLGRAATDEEVAQELGMPLDELHKALDDLKGVTLGAFAEAGEDGEGESLISFVPDPDAEDPSQVFQASELKDILKGAVELLPKKEKFVVQLYYFDELTMKEIGTLLNITESRVSQLHTKAMLRLRGKLLERQIEG